MTQSKRRRSKPSFAQLQPLDALSADPDQSALAATHFELPAVKSALRPSPEKGSPQHNGLPQLIEQDAPLQSRSQLIMMYDRFQAEMPTGSLGVGSWIRQFIDEHGLPSLIRFGQSNRLRVFRRDEFQPWFEPLMAAKH